VVDENGNALRIVPDSKKAAENSKVISLRVSPDLYAKVTELASQSGLDNSTVLRQLLDQGMVETRKALLRKSELVLKEGIDPETARAVIFPDKGLLLSQRYMQDLLFGDWTKDGRALRSSKWDRQ
jgi:predicted transcriptional regulator